MKRLIACVSLVAAATTAAIPATASRTAAAKPHPAAAHRAPLVAQHHEACKVAPADEYFGRLKLSILGIRNTIKDQGLRVDVDSTKAPGAIDAMKLTEDAMHDWQHKYPCDSWIPGTIFALERFYGKIHTKDGVVRVHATYGWLRHDFPKNHKYLLGMAQREDGLASIATPPPVVAGSMLPGTDASPDPDPSGSPSP